MMKRLNKNTRQILTVLLTAAMTFTSAPVSIYADEIIDENIIVSEEKNTDNNLITGVSSFQDTLSAEDSTFSDSLLSDDGGSLSLDMLKNDPDITLSGNEPFIPEDTSEDFFMGEMPEINPIEVENPSFDEYGYDIFGEKSESLPSTYISPGLPQLRSQSPYGACWTFSSMALAEMSMIKQGKASAEDIDLSELHLAYFSYNTVTDPLGGTTGDKNEMNTKDGKVSPGDFMRRGGNRNYSKNVLASWTGAANEADAPYSTASAALSTGLDHALAYKDLGHMTDYYDVQLSTTDTTNKTKSFNEDGINAAKHLIYNYGAIGFSYYSPSGTSAYTSSDLYNSDYNSFFDPDIKTTNHAVTVVGWDDNFSKDHFANATKPKADGAWLVRNSWSDGGSYDAAHQNYKGYFWLSYYSMSNGDSANAFVFDTADNYDNNYQYDGAMTSGTINYSAKWFQGANVFTAQGTNGDVLSAVSFATPTSDVDYEIKIYKDIQGTDGDPSKGTLVESATTTGTTAYAGYHTIPLKSKVLLDAGERFAVSVKISASTSPSLYTEVSLDSNWLTTTAAIQQGQSYRWSGSKWIDISTEGFSNLRIKAFTNNDLPKAEITTAPAAKTGLIYNGSRLSLLTAGTAKNGTLKYRLGETGSYSETIPSVIDSGSYTVYYKAFGDHISYADSDEKSVTVTVSKASPGISAAPAAISNIKYTGMPQALITAGSASGGSFKYKLGPDGTYDTIIPTGTDVGTYKVYYKYFGDKNHNDGAENILTASISYIAPPATILYDGTAPTSTKTYINRVTISSPGYTVSTSSNGIFSSSYTIDGRDYGYGKIETILHFKDSAGYISDRVNIAVTLQKSYQTLSRTLTVPGNITKEYSYDLSNMLPPDAASGMTTYSIKYIRDEDKLFSRAPYIDSNDCNKLKLPVILSDNNVRTAEITIGFTNKDDLYHFTDAVLTVKSESDATSKDLVSIDLFDGKTVDFSIKNSSGISYLGEYEYTGSAIKPLIKRINYNGNLLTAGRDYSVSYKNNIKANESVSVNMLDQRHDPQIIVTFKGDYSGKHILSFKINRISYAKLYKDGRITAEPISAMVKKTRKGYTVQKLKPVIYYEGKKLKLNTDYTLEYNDKENGAYAKPNTDKNPAWNITVKAKGNNFKDSFTLHEILCENTASSNYIPLNARGMKVTLNSTKVEYRDDPDETKGYWPVPTITYTDPRNRSKSKKLNPDNGDYTISVINGTKIGTAKMVLTGVPENGYVGSVTKTFRIVGANLPGNTEVDIFPNSVGYEKDGVKPDINVIYKSDEINGVKTRLYEGVDYKVTYGRNKTVRNSNDKNAPYVRIQGIGNYRGKVTKTFTITKKNIGTLSANNVVVSDVIFSKSKNAYKKTTVILYDTNGKRLKQGTDYTIDPVSRNNVPKAGDTINLTIKGKGNYTGEIRTTYKVLSKSIAKSNIRFYSDTDKKAKTTSYTYTGYEIKPGNGIGSIDLYFGSGKKEQKISTDDYEIAGYYNNIDKGTGYIIIKGKGSYAGVKVFKFKINARKVR